MPFTTRLVPLALLALGCSDPPQMTGTVTDVFGKPLAGATVQLEGVIEHTTTDDAGMFSFDAPEEGERRLMAGLDGYVRNTATVEMPTEKDAPMPEPVIELFPEPDQPGFFAVNKRTVDHLPAKSIKTVGTEIQAYTGLPDVGEVKLTGKGERTFLFRSTLRSSELSRLDLQLHSLDFVPTTTLPGVLGDEEVKVNLHVAKDAQKFDLKALPTEDTYLITTREELKPGLYAFHTEGLLVSDDVKVLENTPKEMQVAYPFEVK